MGNLIVKFYTQAEPTNQSRLLRRIGCKAFTPEEVEDLGFGTKAPILIKQTIVRSFVQAERWLNENVRSLKSKGPFYAFLANNNITEKPQSLRVIFFAPSWTNEARPCPNYTSIATCHNWMRRLLTTAQYAAPAGVESCNRPALASPTLLKQYRKRRSLFFVDNHRDYYFTMPAGCQGACPPIVHPFNTKKSKRYPNKSVYYYAYSVGDTRGIDSLAQNILPGGDELTLERAPLVSPNKRFRLQLSGKSLAVYGGKSNVLFAINMPGRAVRADLGLTSGELSLNYSDPRTGNEELAEVIQISVESAESPLALVLENDGRLNAYDRFNNIVTSPALRQISSAITGLSPDMLDSMRDTAFEEYDSLSEYQRRLRNLLAFLRFHGLLTEYIDVVNLKSPALAGIVPGSIEDVAFLPFDPSANYTDRLARLERYLENTKKSSI